MNAEHAPDRQGRVLPPPSDPMAVARELVAAVYLREDQLLLRRWRGGWWTWESTHWRERDEPELRKVAYGFTELATYYNTAKKTPAVEPWEPNRYKIADLLDALAALCHLREDIQPPEWIVPTKVLPADALVSCANGLLHVGTRTLHAHDPRFFTLVAVPFAYRPEATAPRWHWFLRELWPDDRDSIAALQEFFGYIVAGRTDLHKILLLVGPTRAGKGVIARVLKALIGVGNCAGPTLASLGTNFGLQPLLGKPLAIVSDARLGKSDAPQVVERLLSISGEDMLTVDRKYRDPWTGTLPTRFVIISNELPRFGDASTAIANRFVLLVLTTSFLGRENTKLTHELLPELPGILNWSLAGLERLAAHGHFVEPAASRDAIVALHDLVSPVAAFVRDRCLRGPHSIPCNWLYDAWKRWAEDNGHKAGSLQTFGRDLRAVIPTLRIARPREGDDRPRRYLGVTLQSQRAPGEEG